MTLPATQHLPCSPDLSPADLDAERFRASDQLVGMSEVPQEYQETFTPQQWSQCLSDRFWSHHSYGVCVTPEEWKSGMNYKWVCQTY